MIFGLGGAVGQAVGLARERENKCNCSKPNSDINELYKHK